MTYLTQNLLADNDANGNPQRLWVVYDETANVMALYDEEYYGRAVMPKVYRLVPELLPMRISTGEYRNMLIVFAGKVRKAGEV